MSLGHHLAGRYYLIKPLDRERVGSVWRAHDIRTNTKVALKWLSPQVLESSERLAGFEREAGALLETRSTHAARVLDYGVHDGRPFVIAELLRGESLANRLQRVQKLEPDETADILGQVARALALTHAKGIAHRNLKPENVFLVREDDEDLVKVLDYGIALPNVRLFDCADVLVRPAAVASLRFRSPEQFSGCGVDHLTDLWAIGALALECLTGESAFKGESLRDLHDAICSQPIPVPSRLAWVPDGFDDWFAATVVRDPSRRFQSIQAAANALYFVCSRASRPPPSLETPSATRPRIADAAVSGRSLAPSVQGIASATSEPASRAAGPDARKKRERAAIVLGVAGALLLTGWSLLHKSDAPTAVDSSVRASGVNLATKTAERGVRAGASAVARRGASPTDDRVGARDSTHPGGRVAQKPND